MKKHLVDRLWRGKDPLLQTPINLIEIDKQGWNSQHKYLRDAILEDKPNLVVEIGVWKGSSTIFMANEMKAGQQSGVILAVDTWLGSSEHWLREDAFSLMSFAGGYPAMFHKFAANVIESGVTNHVVPLPLDSLNAAEVLSRLGLRPSVIHLDGAHDYNSVISDLKAWWPLLSDGGLLIGDDYSPNRGWPGVNDAFDEFFNGSALENYEGKCRIRK